ncbi:Cobalt transport protein [Paenibacillus mucilaginosus 3016]|uniref:Cobalt transport protein n=2 Tax=Paenibacillus mucilaginosus TaxID=61624 RepID=H6N9C5_9BACL|nr:cobalt ECF transporter T component CbiQ [Paenibacillus mucilaginosus]AFC27931.1 Cobalt transport protein [Paenibacillus mucilaginosus 3016]AFH60085.1 cobalt ABC transporter [Paenibacillus mucilaginosus K02]WFA16794.1 cobalt ECF transporter T component CbiQ [Paenibacillus mucilaginosus]
MIRQIDTIACTNRMEDVSPLWKSGLAAALLLLAYAAHGPVQLLVILWMLRWTLRHAGVPPLFYLTLLGSACVFYAASLPALLIEFVPSATLPAASDAGAAAESRWTLLSLPSWTVYVTGNGLHTAATLFLRMLAGLCCMFFLMLTTPFPKLLLVLRTLRVPLLVIELMQITYRFLFLLTETAQQLYTAQRARGGQTGFRRRLQDTAALVFRLFGRTMERYKGLSQGLASRGYTGDILPASEIGRFVPPRFRREGWAGLLLLLTAEAGLRWGGGA